VILAVFVSLAGLVCHLRGHEPLYEVPIGGTAICRRCLRPIRVLFGRWRLA
jgi:hypothetical protein